MFYFSYFLEYIYFQFLNKGTICFKTYIRADCHLDSTTVNWKYYYLQAVMPAGNYCGQRKPITGILCFRSFAVYI